MKRDIGHVTAMVLFTVVLSMGLAPLDLWAQEAGTSAPSSTQVPVPAPSAPAPEASAPSAPSAPPVEQQTTQAAQPAPVPSPTPASNQLVSLTGLLMQPPYLAIRVGVALMGAMTSGVVWVIPGENSRQKAQAVWDKTVPYYWGWPEFVGALGGAN